jgi:putative membrane protein
MASAPAPAMFQTLSPFLFQWLVSAFCLWVSTYVFSGIRFADAGSLFVAALLLGVVNALVKPLLVVLTLPLTFVTLGGFLLVINALMILLVAALVRGFTVSGFWTALFASIFISILSFVLTATLDDRGPPVRNERPGDWL